MKKVLALILMLFIFSSVQAQQFGYPVNGEGWYFIKTEFEKFSKKETSWKVQDIFVNQVEVLDYLVFQGDREIFNRWVAGEMPFTLKLRYSWEGEKSNNIKIKLQNSKGKFKILKKNLKSPTKKGYWNPKWKNYLSLIITEDHGFERKNYPVHATVGVLSNYLKSPNEIRLIKTGFENEEITYTEITCQIYDIVKWDDQKLLSIEEKDEKTGKKITRYLPTTTLSLAFLAQLKPHEKATYLVFYNNPSAPKPVYKSDLTVTGKGLGKIIENDFYKTQLDEKSGAIFIVYEKSTGIKLEHKLETNGAIHWNPGVYSPPHTWNHCSDWDNPPYSEEIGPVFYRLQRNAPMPNYKDVNISINYYFYKNSPFIFMESTMEINSDMFVKALRNGEIVFNKAVFNKVSYKNISGDVSVIDLAHTRMHPEHVTVVRPDIPWVALFNEDRGVGFGNLFLENTVTNLAGGTASQQQSYIYIQNGPWYYISRAFVYSFGSNNQARMLPVNKGSLYYEKSAWIPFSFKKEKGYSEYLNDYYNMLKYPVSIFEQIETYPESPRGWLVPILTEPFDEGVEDAIK